MNESFNALFELCEYAEVGDIANGCLVAAAYRILVADGLPWVRSKLLETEGHLLLIAVEGKDLSLNFVTDFEEVLSDAKTWAPAHLRDVDKTFNTRNDLYECTVVSDKNDFALNLVTDFEVWIEGSPRMWSKLLKTESDSLLGLIEVEDDDVDLLVERNDLLRVIYAAPRKVGDVDKTVHTAKVDEYAVRSDVLDGSFEYLAFFELADDLGFLEFEFSLDEGFMRNDDVAEFLVDLDDLEVHSRVDELVVVTDRLDVDLAAWKEGLNAEYVDDHATFGAALDVAFDNLIIVERFVDLIPGTELTCFLVGEDKLATTVFGALYEYVYLVTYFKVRIVTELRSHDDAFALVTDVDYDFPLGDGSYGAFDYFIFYDLRKGLVVLFSNFLTVFFCRVVVFERVPVEFVRVDRCVERCLRGLNCFLCRSLLYGCYFRSLLWCDVGVFLCHVI